MHEDEAFLRAIIETPDDDTPRLIYADWLEERGDPRAEFIRIQCALANLPGRDPDKAALRVRARLCQRSRELLAGHKDEWLRPLADFLRKLRFGWTCGFRRGFVETLHLINPENRRYTFPFLTGSQFGDLFQFAPIRELSCVITLPSLESLLAAPQVARLRSLNLSGSHLGDKGAYLLASSASLADLHALTLVCCGIAPDGVVAVGQSRHLAGLSHLNLNQNAAGTSIGESGLRMWRANPDCGVLALARSFRRDRLRRLDLRSNEIGDTGADALLASQNLPNLESLDLTGNRISVTKRSALRAHFGAVVRF